MPTANRERYEAVAQKFDALAIGLGALRVVEAWGDDLPHGKRTDFYRATDAAEDEAIVFSWIEWPDKATRDAGHAALKKAISEDSEPMDMPFDGSRMIMGSFTTFLSLGAPL